MKKWKIVSLLMIATLLIAALPITTVPASANGPYFYWDISEDGMEAWLIHEGYDIQVWAYYFVDCFGQVYEDEFEEPWNRIGWITLPEDEEGPLGYASALVSHWDDRGWTEPEWYSASRNCVTPPEEAGTVCFQGNTTHVVGLNGWLVTDTLVHYTEGTDFIYYGEFLPEAHETWEQEVVYADAIFAFWDNVLEEWIYSGIIVGGPCAVGPEMTPYGDFGMSAFTNPDTPGDICYVIYEGDIPASINSPYAQNVCDKYWPGGERPGWHEKMTRLVYGRIYDNGTDWGFWESDFLAGHLRRPLFDPDGVQSLAITICNTFGYCP